MADFLKNNQIALRHCIMYEFAGGKSIFDGYRNFCRMLGDDAMEYIEFEFWFQRFSSGKLELNYDRSLEPETRPLSDFPVQIFRKIAMELEPTDLFVIRKVSRNFRDVIDSWNPGFKNISIRFNGSSVSVHYDDHEIAYRRRKLPISNVIGCEVKNGDRIKGLYSEMPGDIAFNDVANVLNNPKLQLDQLVIDCQRFTRKFEEKIQTVGRKQHVGCVKITTNYNQGRFAIYYFLQPETANLVSPRVYIHFQSNDNKENNRSDSDDGEGDFDYESDASDNSYLDRRKRHPKQKILPFITMALKSTELEFLQITTKRTFDTKSIRKYLTDYKQSLTENSAGHQLLTYIYKVSGSTRQFEIELTRNCITIERI